MDNQAREKLIWLAGFIDGEGCIGIQKASNNVKYSKYLPQIGIVNTCFKTIEHIHEILNDLDIGHHIYARKVKSYKHLPQKELRFRGFKRCRKFLPLIIPFLVTKKEQAEVMMEYFTYRDKRHEEDGYHAKWDERDTHYYEKLRSLKNPYCLL